MVKFDYTYYKDNYGGELDAEDFERHAASAYDVISLLIGADAETLNDEVIFRALCLQLDTLATQTSRDCRMTRESLGDYSVSYKASAPLEVASLPISPDAVAALTRGGFLTRWA